MLRNRVSKNVWIATQFGATRRLALAAALLAGFGVCAAQSPQQPVPDASAVQESGFVLHQTVRRVVVDVVVTDAQGNPVTGLKADDFKLKEDNKPQSIRQFEWHGPESAAQPAVPAVHLPARTFMNLPSAPEKGPLTVLLYDVLNTPLDAQPYAHAQMLDFLKKNTGQQIAIFVLSDRLRMLQGFTSDQDLLQRAAASSATGTQRTAWHNGASSKSAENLLAPSETSDAKSSPPPDSQGTGVNPQSALKRMEAFDTVAMLDRRVDITLDAFEQIGRFLAGVNGRKNLIWFSGSFPASIGPDPVDVVTGGLTMRTYGDRMRVASNLLNAAQVALYPVSARALEINSSFDASQTTSRDMTNSSLAQAQSRSVSDFAIRFGAEHATMDDIAQQTGGRAFYNTNGLKEALRAAANDGSAYYTLTYAPTNAKFDGSVRRVAINLERAGYHLAYRKSYFADDIGSTTSQQLSAAEGGEALGVLATAAQDGAPQSHELLFAAHVDAVGQPIAANATQMSALLPFLQQTAKAKKRKFLPPTVPVQLQAYAIQYAVMARQLELPFSARGAYLPHLSLAAMAFDADGNTLYGMRTKIEDVIPPESIDSVFQNGYKPVQFLLAPTNAVRIRLVVRDDRSGKLGSMEIHLPLPEVARAGY